MTTEERKSILSFDPKISMGHIITIVVLLVSAAAFFQNIRLEINDVAHNSEVEDLKLQGQMTRTVDILDRLSDDVKTLKGG